MKENYSDPLSCAVALESFVQATWSEDKEFENINFRRFSGEKEVAETKKPSNKNQPNNK